MKNASEKKRYASTASSIILQNDARKTGPEYIFTILFGNNAVYIRVTFGTVNK